MDKRIRLAALDMDGTLLTSDKRILSETVRDLNEAVRRGVQLALCTGRAVPELDGFVNELPMIRYAVCMSGALVYDLFSKKSVYRKVLPGGSTGRVFRTGEELGAMIHILTDTESIVLKEDLPRMKEYNMEVYQPLFERVARTVDSVTKEAARLDGISKINLYFRSASLREEAFQRLKDLPFTFAFAETSNLEMTAGGVDKAAGLEGLCRTLGISPAEVMGIGDADNDRSFLGVVGVPVAMGNASDEVKKLCGAVTGDNDHNGVGEAILKYC